METVGAGSVFRANPNTLEISGTEGHARVIDEDLYLSGLGMERQSGRKRQGDRSSRNPFQLFLQVVIDEAEAPLVSVDRSAYTQRVMTAIHQNARKREWVEIEQ